MSNPSWRERCAPVIDHAITDGRAANLEGRDLLKFINARWPFGPRDFHPYRIWLDEVRVQLGRRRPRDGSVKTRPKDLEGQGRLFR